VPFARMRSTDPKRWRAVAGCQSADALVNTMALTRRASARAATPRQQEAEVTVASTVH